MMKRTVTLILLKGRKVRMMDTNDTAIITGFGKDYYELELDGLTIRAVRSEFIPVDAEEDRRLRNAIPSRSHKAAKEEPVFEDNTGDLTVDLHIERIPGSDGIPEWAALDFQMNYFRQVLRKNPALTRQKGGKSPPLKVVCPMQKG